MQMRKTLMAALVLSAVSCATLAADVRIYGVLDTSLVFEAVDDGVKGGRKNTTYMSSGEEWGSRWGIRGTEDLGNGTVIGFDLQSGIRSDDGTGQYSRLFARESSLWVKNAWGKLAVGRMDGLIGLRGQTGKLKMLSAFGDGYGPYMPSFNNVMSEPSYIDNSIFYESPKMAGVTVRAHYGMGGVSYDVPMHSVTSATENESTADRYAAMTVTYNNGPLNLMIGVDSVNFKSYKADAAGHNTLHDVEDSLTVTLGGNYDLGVARLYAAAQYFDEIDSGSIRKFIWSGIPGKLTGYGASLSADIPAADGNVMVAVSWLDAEAADSVTGADKDNEVSRFIVGVGYQLPLSKRTHLYGIASWGKDEVKTPTSTAKPDYYKAVIGLRHLF